VRGIPRCCIIRSFLKDVVSKPEVIFGGKQREGKAVRYVTKTHLGAKYLVVVYREENSRKAIITAYFTSDLKRIKGDLVWKA
jgi:hypothetical protein